MDTFLEKQRMELMRIKQERTCPPITLLRQGGNEIERHLQSCPHCRERLEEITRLDILVDRYCTEGSLFNHEEGKEYIPPQISGAFPVPTFEEYYKDKLEPVPNLEWHTEKIKELLQKYETDQQQRRLKDMELSGAKSLSYDYDDTNFNEKDDTTSSKGIPFPKKNKVEQGEIRIILDDSVPSIYNKYGWHNPPKVVIIETEEETGISGLVRVAQLHDSDSLANFGDIGLENSRYYAESWNCYPQFLDSLSIPFDHATQEEINAILEHEKNPLPFTPEENSPCYFFRQTELNIGSFYGSRAAARATDFFEAPYEYSFNLISRLHPEFAAQLNDDKIRFRDYQEFALAAAAADGKTIIYILKEDGSEEKLEGEYRTSPFSGFTEITLPSKGNYYPDAIAIAQTETSAVTAAPALYRDGYCQCKFLSSITEKKPIRLILIQRKEN